MAKAKKPTLGEKNTALTAENEELQRQVENLQQLLATSNERIQGYRDEHKALKKRISQKDSETQETQNSLREACERNDNLVEQIRQHESRIGQLEALNKRLTESNGELSDQVAERNIAIRVLTEVLG